MGLVVELNQSPPVPLGVIFQDGVSGIEEAEGGSLPVGLGGDAQDGAQRHVQDTAVRDNQIPPRGAVQQALHSLPCAQVQFPFTLSGLADGGVGVAKIGPWILLGGYLVFQASQHPVVQFHPEQVKLERDRQ